MGERYKVFLAVFTRQRHLEKVPDIRPVLKEKRPVHTGLIKIFIKTLLCRYWVGRFRSLQSIPGPALFPGAGAAERPQEILYI